MPNYRHHATKFYRIAWVLRQELGMQEKTTFQESWMSEVKYRGHDLPILATALHRFAYFLVRFQGIWRKRAPLVILLTRRPSHYIFVLVSRASFEDELLPVRISLKIWLSRWNSSCCWFRVTARHYHLLSTVSLKFLFFFLQYVVGSLLYTFSGLTRLRAPIIRKYGKICRFRSSISSLLPKLRVHTCTSIQSWGHQTDVCFKPSRKATAEYLPELIESYYDPFFSTYCPEFPQILAELRCTGCPWDRLDPKKTNPVIAAASKASELFHEPHANCSSVYPSMWKSSKHIKGLLTTLNVGLLWVVFLFYSRMVLLCSTLPTPLV